MAAVQTGAEASRAFRCEQITTCFGIRYCIELMVFISTRFLRRSRDCVFSELYFVMRQRISLACCEIYVSIVTRKAGKQNT